MKEQSASQVDACVEGHVSDHRLLSVAQDAALGGEWNGIIDTSNDWRDMFRKRRKAR